MSLHITDAEVAQANALVGDTPMVVGRRIIARIERERGIPQGYIRDSTKRGPTHYKTKNAGAGADVSTARTDALIELYLYFEQRGRKLTLGEIARVFTLAEASVHYALKRRGIR